MVTLGTDGSGAVLSGPTLAFYVGGSATPISVTVAADKNTVQGVADAINATANLDVRASVVSTDAGKVIQLTATKTGAAAAFTLDDTDPLTDPQTLATPKTAVLGEDAQITVGNPATTGYTASSSTNTFADVIAGVTFTASQIETGVTIAVTADAAGLADKMQAMVESAGASLA